MHIDLKKYFEHIKKIDLLNEEIHDLSLKKSEIFKELRADYLDVVETYGVVELLPSKISNKEIIFEGVTFQDDVESKITYTVKISTPNASIFIDFPKSIYLKDVDIMKQPNKENPLQYSTLVVTVNEKILFNDSAMWRTK